MGVLAAMVTHAAGESAVLCDTEFQGATAVVLEAQHEEHLLDIVDILKATGIEHVLVQESGGEYHDQYMAIGIRPGTREELSTTMRPFKILSACKNTANDLWEAAFGRK